MNKEQRNALRNMVVQCRRLLEKSIADGLQGQYGIHPTGEIEPANRLSHLSEEDKAYRQEMLAHIEHIQASGYKAKDALAQLVREIAFTHLNRLCAYKMMEAREVVIGGKPFREAVSRGVKSQGFQFYLADDEHKDDKKLVDAGQQDIAYRHFLSWLGALLSDEIGVLFSPTDAANRLFPPQRVLDDVLALLNSSDLKDIWSEDEAIGWVYQYFTPKELRDQVRKESSAPRNSYELAFRNQFFTPRYVVEFLTDNTLGRIWYEMRKGGTKLKDQCRYMVRRPSEVFLAEGLSPPEPTPNQEELSQEDLLKQPVYIPNRLKKDPRDLRILDPACGSGHFLLYCFDLLLTIYEEAYADPDLGPKLKRDYPTLEALLRDVPRLILAHNLHGIDIDLRASQIAALALWLRCQRAYREMSLKQGRPKITKSNIVCAEPMPGESDMLKEFVADLQPKVLGHLVEVVFDKMKLAGEAGSLLKIEEELRDAIADVKKKWVAETEQATDRKGHPLLFTVAEMDRLSKRTQQPQLFDFSEITDEQFWNEVEGQVLASLRNYAAHAASGGKLRKQLFAEDAERGFAFIDLCQKQFDVVLMNPPFGDAPHSVRPYLSDRYSNWGNDIYVAFGSRALSFAGASGSIGAITSRLGFFLSSFSPWREEEILRESTVSCFADLGYGVLDEALVEVAAWVLLLPQQTRESVFIRLLGVKEKQDWLLPSMRSIRDNCQPTQFGYFVAQNTFSCVDGSPFCYWVSDTLRKRLQQFPRLNEVGGDARQGMSTADDERYLRLAWEVNPSEVGGNKRWVLFAKGGEYSPYYDDIHLLVDWNNGQSSLVGSGAFLRNQRFYLHPGLTYSQRSTSAFNPKLFPADCIFSTGGHGVFMDVKKKGLFLLGVLSSRITNLQVEMAVGSGDDAHSGSAARNYLNGMVNTLRCPNDSGESVEKTASLTRVLVDLARDKSRHDETTRLFVAPAALLHKAASLAETLQVIFCHEEDNDLRMVDTFAKLDETICDSFGLDERDREELDLQCGGLVSRLSEESSPSVKEVAECFEQDIPSLIGKAQGSLGSARFISKKAYVSSRRLELAARLFEVHPRKIVRLRRESGAIPPELLSETTVAVLQYIVGVGFGRWDARFVTGQLPLVPLPAPFDPLPASSPGMLVEADGLTAKKRSHGYPLRIDSDGIIPDDADHSDDMVRRVREILELIWEDRAEAIEIEACEILGVKELREYYRKPGKGGFWDDHVSRYSKSRRKAPIYWLLQSSKKNYGLWLYYHRLDKDMLFKARQNYVDPKIRLEETRLESLRSQKTALGADAKGAKKIDKDIERQETLLGELKDFADKLERAAKLNFGNPEKLDSAVVYDPDLNDGVVLNIAPLWELVPWKEAKNYWEELLEGKYEWSSMGKLLRKKGLVK